MLYNPVYELERMQDILDGLFRSRESDGGTGIFADLDAANLYESDNAYLIQFPAPGVAPENVSVGFENGLLTVSIERREDRSGKKYIRRERGDLKTTRSYSVSGDVDVEKIEARLLNGILMVSVPKKEQAKPRKIAVQVR